MALNFTSAVPGTHHFLSFVCMPSAECQVPFLRVSCTCQKGKKSQELSPTSTRHPEGSFHSAETHDNRAVRKQSVQTGHAYPLRHHLPYNSQAAPSLRSQEHGMSKRSGWQAVHSFGQTRSGREGEQGEVVQGDGYRVGNE